MASQQQITANQTNPRKHGLSSGFALLKFEEPSEYYALLDSIAAEMKPITEHERFLVNLMAQSRWKMLRVQILEADLFEKMMDGGNVEKQLALLHRYSVAAERSYYKAHKELTSNRRAELKTDSAALDYHIKHTIYAPMPGQEPDSFRKTPNAAESLGNLALRL